MEWAICRFEVDKMCQEQPFVCPPCTPEMLAVAVDGNRKHYRFKKAGRYVMQTIYWYLLKYPDSNLPLPL